MKFLALLAAALLVSIGCGSNQSEPDALPETLMARVGDRTISKNEFIRRAEYTIRPVWCRGDNYIHRKIVLNSLVAEKLLALESSQSAEVMNNPEFQDYLTGRREQAMRRWHFYKEGTESAQVDSSAVKSMYRAAGRTYEVAYFTVRDTMRARIAGELIARGTPFEELYSNLGGQGDPPVRTVAFNAGEHPAMLRALFSAPVDKDRVVGPISDESGGQTVLAVKGWTSRAAISETDIRRRWDDVGTWLKEQAGLDRYEAYVGDLMRGKRIEFMPQTFRKLVEIVGPHYVRSRDEKTGAMKHALWNRNDTDGQIQDLGADVDRMKDEPLYRIDGEVWTVAEFERELRRHPLVFRKDDFSQSEFAEQFRLAIVDMVRDSYITADAYEKGYHNAPAVRRDTQMWRDNLFALTYLNNFLASKGKIDAFREDPAKVIESDLNPLVRELQRKYSSKIELNMDLFEETKLTRIDLMVLQKKVPFPILVPSFPMLTSRHELDYGSKMAPE